MYACGDLCPLSFKTIEEWKQYLPDLDVLKSYFPNEEAIESWRTSMRRFGKGMVQKARQFPDAYESSKQVFIISMFLTG